MMNDETAIIHIVCSSQTGSCVQEFRNAVRLRDRGCPITREMALGAEDGNWKGFQAAHVFPLVYEQMWNYNNFARWITIPPTTGGTINSVQNGILLESGTLTSNSTHFCSRSTQLDVYTSYILCKDANTYFRIITRSFISATIRRRY